MNLDDKYREIRDQIKHEDALISQRTTWLLTFQAFLLGGYGLSLTAESGARGDLILPEIRILQETLAPIGLVSSLLLLLSLSSAALSMKRLVDYWYIQSSSNRTVFPQIIGNDGVFGKKGMWFGLIPVAALPLSCAAAWSALELGTNKLIGYIIATLFVVMSTTILVYLGYIMGKRSKVP